MARCLNVTDVVVPEFWSDVADGSMFRSRELYKVFGYANTGNLTRAVQNGSFPRPDKIVVQQWHRAGMTGKVECGYWTKLTVMKEVARRRALGKVDG